MYKCFHLHPHLKLPPGLFQANVYLSKLGVPPTIGARASLIQQEAARCRPAPRPSQSPGAAPRAIRT